MIASASIPVAVPPVYFNVEVDGKSYEQMHVAGGMMTQVFGVALLKYAADAWRRAGYKVTGRVYTIRNSRVVPEWEIVEPRIAKIAGRSMPYLLIRILVSRLWKASLKKDLNTIPVRVIL